MRTLLKKKVTAFVAIASLASCPFVSSMTIAMPSQGGVIASASKPTGDPDFRNRSESDKLARNTVLVRNTTPKTESTPIASTGKEQKTDDKKTIGRCWKRLMNMVREVNHAHRNTKK